MDLGVNFAAATAVSIRCLGVISLLPLAQGAVSQLQRFSLSLLIALALQGVVPAQSFSFWGLAGEFLIGIIIAVPTAIVLECAAIWGELLDWGRGQTMANLIDPLTHRSTAPTAMLLHWAIWIYVITAGGLELVLNGFAQSFQLVPAFALEVSMLPGIGQRLLVLIGQQLSGVFGIFLPLACIYLLVDFCVGILSKLLPQVSFTHESFISKSALALIFLCIVSQMQLEESLPTLIAPRLAIIERGTLK